MKNGLKEIIDPRKYGNDKNKVFKIVMDISRKIEYEVPNSATFTMALDSIENDEIIYCIAGRKKNFEVDDIISVIP